MGLVGLRTIIINNFLIRPLHFRSVRRKRIKR